jgi:4-hydroxy-4-methyl-2-oxoglutarate aldolase
MSQPHHASPVDELARYSPATVLEVLQKLGINAVCEKLDSRSAPSATFCGRAFTVQFMPCGTPDARTPNGNLTDYLYDVPAGYVLALDNRGRADVSVWGDEMARLAIQRGIAGVVVDGASDPQSPELPPFHLVSRSRQGQTGANRVRVEALNLAVVLGGVRVECDDVILGDAQQVVVVPRDYLKIVLNHLAPIPKNP